MTNIKVGTQVKAAFESLNHNAITESFGKVVNIGSPIRNSNDFVATILWNDGSLVSLTALFFRQTVQVVDEAIA